MRSGPQAICGDIKVPCTVIDGKEGYPFTETLSEKSEGGWLAIWGF